MRIGIDVRLWSQTGVGRYIKNLVLNLHKLDNKNEYVLFVNIIDYENLKSQILNLKKGWKLEDRKWKIVATNIRWHTLKEQIQMPKILNKENLDLVHFPYFSIPFFYNKPYVITIHDLIINHFPTGRATLLPLPIYFLKRKAYDIIISNAVGKAKKIIAPSLATKEELVSHYGISEEKIIVTYEGGFDQISKIAYEKSTPIKSELDVNNKRYFLYVGNAYPHKNLDLLINAFSSFLKESNREIYLILVGKEDYFYKELKLKVQEMDINKFIKFYGEARDMELLHLYKNAKALVIPSLMEGFGLTALEAMSLGTLVLASKIPSFIEICEKNVFYFNPQDAEDLKDKLKMVYNLDIKTAKKMKNGAVERAKFFSWQKMASQTYKIYESCSTSSE